MMMDALAVAGMVLGSMLLLVAAIGVIRFPDTLARTHALGLGATLGLALLMGGVVFALRDVGATAKAVLTVLFVFVTAPVGSHMLGLATYRFGRTPKTLRKDDLAGEIETSESDG